MLRHDGRQPNQLRPIRVQRDFPSAASGSVLISAGNTVILCTASVGNDLPAWKLALENPTGWVTAEYNMLPGCTAPRKARRQDGRGTEIQRLIGRSLRAVIDFVALGPRLVTVDCDVIKADGGTRTLSITGGFIAMVDALAAVESPGFDYRRVFLDSVAAVSVGIHEGQSVLDLDYPEDSRAEVDTNVVMTGRGEFVEVQGTAERGTFAKNMLLTQLDLASQGIVELTRIQKDALGPRWPF